MPIAIQNNDPAYSSGLPVQKPGQQFGSISVSPNRNRFTQLDVINAARRQVQTKGSYTPSTDPDPLYTPNGNTNGYQESAYLPGGKPMPGPIGTSATNRASMQGYAFVPLSSPTVYGGSISDTTPPPAADTYVR